MVTSGCSVMIWQRWGWREFLSFFKGHSQSLCTALTAGKCLPFGLCKDNVSLGSNEPHSCQTLVRHASGTPGTFSPPPTSKKPLESDPGMHHGTCVTHVPGCMSGWLTSGGRENVPGIPGACATRNFTYLARGPWCRALQMRSRA